VIAVDTSVLIDFLKGRTTPATERLRRLEADAVPYAIPGVCCQEVLQGARDEREWRLLCDCLETQTLLFPRDPWATHVAAARLFFDCRRKGLNVRGSLDCFVAQLALENGAVLLHDDDDYDRIARVRPLKAARG
jgi:predicted nucleic acid-binding protein